MEDTERPCQGHGQLHSSSACLWPFPGPGSKMNDLRAHIWFCLKLKVEVKSADLDPKHYDVIKRPN